MGAPANISGTRASARRSRMPANMTMARVKPAAEPKSYTSAVMKLWFSWLLIRTRPSTAQLVAISGR